MDSKDCGPTCLKIISKHYGRYYRLSYLREVCAISREGVSFYDLGLAAEKLGFRSRSYAVSVAQFFEKVPLPCILHWNSNHFVVAYKVKKQKIYISDPNLGLISYTSEEFKNQWMSASENKGKIIVLEPSAEFYDRGHKKNPENRNIFAILKYFRPYHKSVFNLLLVMFIVTLLQGLLPFISRAVIDTGIQTNDIDFINIVLIANITIIVAMMLGNSVRDWILLHITSRVNIALVSDYLVKLMRLPITFFESKLVGDILQRSNDHERIRNFITGNALNLVFATITFFVFTIVLLIFNPIIFLIFLLGNAIYITWVLSSLRWRKKLDWESFDITSKNQSYWVETIGCIQDIKTNNYEMHRRWGWEEIQSELYRVNQRVLKLNNIQSIGAQFIANVTNLVITFYCAKAVIQGEITFGVMISTQFIIGMLNGPILQFIQYVHSYQYAKISYQRLNEVHELKNEQDEDLVNNIELPKYKSLIVKNVSFRYSANSSIILNNVSFIVPEKCITAIVGESGSGKSTLLKLLLRLYKPSVGEIQIGNMNLNSVNLKNWRDKCACVLQDGKIFNDTIMNNIILGDQHLDYEKLKRCVEAANISTEIEELPNGYKTLLGETGQGISGGQKQRILIARALYKEPEYLMLDEATNALDSVNELKIVTALDTIFKDKTVVIVAHRLSTIQRAHQIIVLRKGQIAEAGNHESLMKINGHYRKLIESQLGPVEHVG